MRIKNNKAGKEKVVKPVKEKVPKTKIRQKRGLRNTDDFEVMQDTLSDDVDIMSQPLEGTKRIKRKSRSRDQISGGQLNVEENLLNNDSEKQDDSELTEEPTKSEKLESRRSRRNTQRRSSRVGSDVFVESVDKSEDVDLSNANDILHAANYSSPEQKFEDNASRPGRKRRVRREIDSGSPLKPSNTQDDVFKPDSNVFNMFEVDDDDNDEVEVPVAEETTDKPFFFFNTEDETQMVIGEDGTLGEGNISKFKDIEFPDVRKEDNSRNEENRETTSLFDIMTPNVRETMTDSKEQEESQNNTSVLTGIEQVQKSNHEVVKNQEVVSNQEVCNNQIPECTVSEEPLVDKADTECVKNTFATNTIEKVSESCVITKGNIFDRLENITDSYNSRNAGVCSEDVVVNYFDESVKVSVQDTGVITMPNSVVYINGFKRDWDKVNETRVGKDDIIELDLGVGFSIPDGYELMISGVKDLQSKYGLVIEQEDKIIRQAALFPIVIRLKAINDVAYIQKYRSIINATFVKIQTG